MTSTAKRTDPSLRERANRAADVATTWLGSVWALALSVVLVVGWLVTGPLFGFSDTWQLVINTGTTIVTFLMVFLIQSTQNRDSEAVQVKLDEIIRAVGNAKNELLDLEELEEEDLDEIRETYMAMAKKAREKRK
jgi:low affinity Fe/Cu permease